MVQLQQLREEAEKAREEALAATHEATRQREEHEASRGNCDSRPRPKRRLASRRSRLQPGDAVHVQRFGSVGRVVRVDHKRAVAVVSVGLGQWEVPLEEVTPSEG